MSLGDLTAKIRPLESSDQEALWNWLHIALWDPPPAGLRPREVLDNAAVEIYAEGWGREGAKSRGRRVCCPSQQKVDADVSILSSTPKR